MTDLKLEIKETINLMQTDICEGSHAELQLHLHDLLQMRRTGLEVAQAERSWSKPANGIGLYQSCDVSDCSEHEPSMFRTQFEPKRREEIALTADELKAGGWWCGDVSEDCRLAFVDNGVDVWSGTWAYKTEFMCCYLSGTIVLRSSLVNAGLKQVHRRGNNFYWTEK